MAANFIPSAVEYFRIMPELILTIAATLIMLLEGIFGERNKGIYPKLTGFALLAALWGAVVAYSNPGPAFQSMLIIDAFATFFRVLVIIVGILSVLCSIQYLRRERAEGGEFHAL